MPALEGNQHLRSLQDMASIPCSRSRMPLARIVWHARRASLTCLEIISSLGLHASCWEAVRGEAAGSPRMSARATCSEGADLMALVWGACRAAREHSRFA